MTLSMASNLEDPYTSHHHLAPQNPQAHTKESIHSGQFMVSHLESEAQDDDDTELKIPDPDDETNLERVANECTVLQRYVPSTTRQVGHGIVTNPLEIETTLTKLFKCLNLAYSQKLTSPKWNHFKGIRLRMKDKIRLNNVIWRCWHMQFILKKRTPVCQFASPLDVDVHSNPESVVLEGKYWKRQVSVIKAEYRKWRRNFKIKAIGGCAISDLKSEADLIDWSPFNERHLMISDDWTSDTLFSSINGPFPFPDPREIARGAGLADFIQPSLGPLQPNIDDIDIDFQDFLQNHRLPTVPEEVTDDLFKSVDYNFPAIMGTEQMDSANITDVTNSVQPADLVQQMDDSSMLDLNTPLSNIQYNGKLYVEPINIDQQTHQPQSPEQNIIVSAENKSLQILPQQTFDNSMMEGTTQTQPMLMEQKPNPIILNAFSLGNLGQMNNADLTLVQNVNQFNANHLSNNQLNTNQINNSVFSNTSKNILKGRISKPTGRPFRRREPHNYDKAQPTSHQTIIYQKMLAEQQQQQQQQQQQHQQASQPLLAQIQFTQQFPTSTTNFQTQNILNLQTGLNNVPNVTSFQMTANVQPMAINNQKVITTQPEFMSLLNASSNQQIQTSAQSSPYQSYPIAPNFKKSVSTPSYISPRNMRQASPQRGPPNSLLIEQQQQTAKEMFRSNSLPLNSSLQSIQPKEESFVVPRVHFKPQRSRSRSNSMQQSSSQGGPPLLQTANSEPLLNINNSALAQLLTTSTNTTKLSNKHSTSTGAIHSHSLPPSGFNSSLYNTNSLQVQPGAQSQSKQQTSPTRTQSLPHTLLHSPPGGNPVLSFPNNTNAPTSTRSISPDSFADQDSPLSPTRLGSSNLKYSKDPQRRAGHIHAEQKRRYNIKNGFDTLHSLIPQLSQNPNPKLSKAAMLQKGAEYIKQLRGERNTLNEKMDSLRKERDTLNNSLAHLQSILPVNGAPISRQRTERVQQLYNQYVCYRATENWKFWILGLILEPLVGSYTNTVSTASMEELYRTALLWVDKHCSLVDLRPAVCNKLRYLSTTTDILSEPPSSLRDEVMRAMNNQSGQHPNLHSS